MRTVRRGTVSTTARPRRRRSPLIVERLAENGPQDTASIVIEKPFGRDLESAKQLTAVIQEVFDESRIFRMDHYLGKETVQNILVFRFANSLFERAWNREAIDHIQITVAESIGVESRGAYYEESGAIRDIVQNHCSRSSRSWRWSHLAPWNRRRSATRR